MHITSHQPSPTGMLRIHFLTDEVMPGDHQVHWQPPPGWRVLSPRVPALVSQLIIRLILQQVRKRKRRAAWDRTGTGWRLCVWLLPPVPLLFHSLPLLKSSLRSTSYETQRNKSRFIHKMKRMSNKFLLVYQWDTKGPAGSQVWIFKNCRIFRKGIMVNYCRFFVM